MAMANIGTHPSDTRDEYMKSLAGTLAALLAFCCVAAYAGRADNAASAPWQVANAQWATMKNA